MLNVLVLTTILFSDCWLVAVGGFVEFFSWFIGNVNFLLKCSSAESLNRVYQYFRSWLSIAVMLKQR